MAPQTSNVGAIELMSRSTNFIRTKGLIQSLWFPVVVLLAVLMLSALEISGSSIALYETSSGKSDSSSGVLIGQPRPVRSDEWLVRAPWFLNQVKNGSPSFGSSGIGQHDLGVSGDIPVWSLDVLVKPHQVTSFIFSPAKAFAAEWWIWHGLMICGMYTFIHVLTKRPGIAVAISLLLVTSPSTQWWSAPGTFTTIGYGTLAAAFFLKSLERTSKSKCFVSLALAGWFSACFVSTLYLPWIITTTLILGTICLTRITIQVLSAERRKTEARRILSLLGVALVFSGLLIGIYVQRHADALARLNETVYPGSRSSESGGGLNLATVFGAPLDYYSWSPQTVSVNGTNQSENSGGIIYLMPVAVAIGSFLLLRKQLVFQRSVKELLATVASGFLLLSWAVLPVPTSFGKFFLLDRVPPTRILPALTFVSLIALAQYLTLSLKSKRRSESVAIASSALFFLGISAFAANQYQVENARPEIWNALILIGVVSFGIWLALWKYLRIGLCLLVIFGSFQFLNTNPLQKGLSPLLDNPLAVQVNDIQKTFSEEAGWMAVGTDIYVRGTIEATGVSLVSAVSRYPDYEAWRVLDPTLKYEDAWNRYGHIFVSVGEKGADPIILSPQGDVIQIILDPCDERLRRINVDVLVTQNFELDGCGNLINSIVWGERTIRFYSVS